MLPVLIKGQNENMSKNRSGLNSTFKKIEFLIIITNILSKISLFLSTQINIYKKKFLSYQFITFLAFKINIFESDRLLILILFLTNNKSIGFSFLAE